jgi:hypothetical protein
MHHIDLLKEGFDLREPIFEPGCFPRMAPQCPLRYRKNRRLQPHRRGEATLSDEREDCGRFDHPSAALLSGSFSGPHQSRRAGSTRVALASKDGPATGAAAQIFIDPDLGSGP